MSGCIIQDCTEDPIYKCICSRTNKYCEMHADSHITLDGVHEMVINYTRLYPEKVMMVKRGCEDFISSLKSANFKMLEYLNMNIHRTTKIAMDFIKENREIEDLYNQVLNYLKYKNKVIIKEVYEPEEEFILKYLDIPKEILKYKEKETRITLESFNLNERLKESDAKNSVLAKENTNLVRKAEKWKNKLKNFKLELSEDDAYNQLLGHQSKFLYFSHHGTKNLCVVSLVSERETREPIDMPDTMGVYTGFSLLPGKKLFYYSNSGNGPSDICYIINLETKTAVKQQGFKAKSNIGSCCVFENCVYAFGGSTSATGSCSDSEKFDLSAQNWKAIAPITACHFSSTIATETNIIITAYNLSSIIEYNPLTDSYSSYLNGKFNLSHVVLCKALNKIYLISQNSLWDITEYNNISALNAINMSTGVPNYALISNPTRYGLNVYFILANKEIWRLSLANSSITRVRICNI